MTIADRIGVDLAARIALEQGIEWAHRHAVRYVDVQLDTDANAVTAFDDRRAGAIRERCAELGITLGLHTLSAVNVAEYSPFESDAVDAYLKSYIDIYPKLGAHWIVVHAGYHFTSDVAARMHAGCERLKRIVDYAEKNGAMLYLENLNKEPVDAEVHYLAHTVDEWMYYFDRIDSPNLRMSFTANHAHLVPEGVDGFIDAIDFARVGEVRLADCDRLGHEVHRAPGEGDLDFARMFQRIETAGFSGHSMQAFGTLDAMLAGREYLVAEAAKVGVR
ncbi:MAG: sugar phosphate isomerase/epimerase [Proteobacteria bacterium]|nr:sugar phosphate isomerase/epimerase [Burkholderiales bacterium]